MSEEELVGVEQASATAAEVTGSIMRIKLELEDKIRTVNMLQAALVGRGAQAPLWSSEPLDMTVP